MKNFVQLTLAATLVAGAAASHQHQHQHNHARRHASRVAKRGPAAVAEIVVSATETVYELSGKVIDGEDAKKGIKDGKLVIVGETEPSYTPPPPPPKPKTSSTSSISSSTIVSSSSSSETEEASMGAQFIEIKESTSTPEPTPSSTSVYVAPTKAAAPKKPSKPSSGGGYSTGSGVDRKFDSGKVKCSEFPSAYGAVALDWLDFGGWSGIQFVPKFTLDALSISEIHTAIKGDGCTKGAMCSYSCPAGYQKTQWPKAQGADRESIGGLYCNNEGYLELTRKDAETLCEPGVGGVSIQNDLDDTVSTCRTDYPGTENMVIPATAGPGETVSVCNPDQTSYYQWMGNPTSAQYYVNKKGYAEKDACVWTSALDPKGAGNWAPVVLGVGRAKDGNTYIGIFQNLPTSTAQLDFNIEIKVDGKNSPADRCAFINGKWIGGATGCTATMPPGGKAVVRYF